LKFNILLRQVWDLNSHNSGNFRWLISRKEIWESRKIDMPKIIRFSSPLCTLFHKSISHYLQHKIHKRFNSKQQAYTTFNRQTHSKKSYVQSLIYASKFKNKTSSQFSQNITKNAQINQTWTHIFLKRISTCNCIPKTSIKY
jgi:hypothetical protein